MNTKKEQATLRDALLHAQFDLGKDVFGASPMGLYGFGVASLRDGDDRLKQVVPFSNVITDTGDEYIARKVAYGLGQTITNVPPNGMKLGLLGTAVAKNGTGSYIAVATGDYIGGSNVAFDVAGGFVSATVVSAGQGWTTNFQTIWPAGTATATILSAEICNNQATNAGHTNGTETLARTIFASPGIAKGGSDSLTILWKWTAKGALA